MNIKEAKEFIKDSVRIYLKKDDEGEYRIPLVRQRPIFMLGAPGVGKTAIMEQIAQELGIALVSYSMTHHTRQSALGLPYIAHREYEGMEYDVSEYTMSEIISSVYDVMKVSGVREGILFLDEINCVSETLAPSMLQFLQYKVFGRHRVPDGWVIVTAGNPPEYNKSVRNFDVVTMDRLKLLEVEADYTVWKEYAREKGIHIAIMNYLDIKKDNFYGIETTAGGKNYITARGWEDLSTMILLYEEENLTVNDALISQYIHNQKVVKEFAAYYDLYQKYKNDYHVEDILCGKVKEQTKEKARRADFDERLSLMGMLMDQIQTEIRENMEQSRILNELMNSLKAVKAAVEKGASADEIKELLAAQAAARNMSMESLLKAGAMSDKDKRKNKAVIRFLEASLRKFRAADAVSAKNCFELIKSEFDAKVADYKGSTMALKDRLHYLFVFVEETFGSGNEMLILVTECTVLADCVEFIGKYGCEDYQKHTKDLMLTERTDRIMDKIDKLFEEI